MATDGADFGKMKACYGRVYTALRVGADDAAVADLTVRCLEREVRFDRGAPAFEPAVQLATLVSGQDAANGSQQLVRTIDRLARALGASPLTRDILSAAEKITLAALRDGAALSRNEAGKAIIAQVVRSRCEGMSAYTTRHRTHSIKATEILIDSVSSKVRATPSLHDFATRMLNGTAKGMPAKPARLSRIDHSAEGLNSTSLESGL